ncbi:MAG: fibrillarin-like rRNA/tRNA 2'-O-methyltransferase, partial [Candidatus Methanoperedens sp.]|nr:fibrillarin-like rRNA/tRNA 2'-O-methyltransferase [Candidatus Methanoperedens sp.]
MEDIKIIETGLDNAFILIEEGSKWLVTKNLTPGIQVYGEKLTCVANVEYRLWDPYRSKLAAMIMKCSSVSLKKDYSVLYLGAANGTTASHVSDIVSLGEVFAVEFSPRAMHDLIRVSIPRLNLIPILADALHPNSYKNMVGEVDFLYQDIAQREQARIAIRNAELFLKNHARDRLDLARPGPRHRADPDPGGPAGRRSTASEHHPGRHRRGRLRHGHRRLAFDHHERQRHRDGQRQDHRQ